MWIRYNMMHENNTMSQHNSLRIIKKLFASLAADNLFGLALALLCLGGALAQAEVQPTMPIKESLDAYGLVDRWIHDWAVPDPDANTDANTDPGVIETAPVSAAVVTIRIDGKVIGRGQRASFEPSSTLVWQAVSDAIESGNAKLRNDGAQLREEVKAALRERVMVTLELGDKLVPMSKSEIELPGFGYTPGVLGVVVARGDQLAIAGPESMLSRNTDMTQSAMALANQLAGDGSAVLKTPAELVEAGYRFYRFEPVVLSPPSVGMGPEFLDRGSRVIRGSEISVAAINEMGREIAKHLMSRIWEGAQPYGLTGTLDPISGTHEGKFAQPFEQALGAYALLRFASSGSQRVHRDAFLAGKGILRDLSLVIEGESPAWDDPIASAMVVVALSEMQLVDILGDEELNRLRLMSLEKLDGLYAIGTGFDGAIEEGSEGLVVFALGRTSRLDPTDRSAIAKDALHTLMDQTPAPALVAQMPFLGWAILEMGSDGDEAEFAEKLSTMRELVWEHQLRREDLAWMDRDLEGGIVFTSAKAPLPSWLSLRPMACLSTMLGDSRLTPGTLRQGELPKQLAHQVNAIRFVRQLCATDSILHLYMVPDEARWGVRMALWDQRMPAEVDAMALLTLNETSQSFKRILSAQSKD